MHRIWALRRRRVAASPRPGGAPILHGRGRRGRAAVLRRCWRWSRWPGRGRSCRSPALLGPPIGRRPAGRGRRRRRRACGSHSSSPQRAGRQPLLLRDRRIHPVSPVLVPAHRHVSVERGPAGGCDPQGSRRSLVCGTARSRRCGCVRVPHAHRVATGARHRRVRGDGPSCTDVWFRQFGFLSLATMALVGFLTILTLLFVRFPATRTSARSWSARRLKEQRSLPKPHPRRSSSVPSWSPSWSWPASLSGGDDDTANDVDGSVPSLSDEPVPTYASSRGVPTRGGRRRRIAAARSPPTPLRPGHRPDRSRGHRGATSTGTR